MEKRDGFIPKEDIEFERELREREQQEDAERQRLLEEKKEQEEKNRAEYEKQLQDKKIELMKLRQGVIESSDVVKEVHEEAPKQTALQKVSNAWYRSKWLILFVIAMVIIVAYITYDMVTADVPDLTVLVVSSDPGFYYRTEEIQSFFEDYCGDKNGDGETHVMIYNISTDYSDPNTATASQAQLMSQLQTGENVLVLSDQPTDFIMKDLREEYPGDGRITELGLLINCEFTREKLKWEAMPEGVYLGVRQPARLLSTSEETMEENVREVMPVFERIREDVEKSGE